MHKVIFITISLSLFKFLGLKISTVKRMTKAYDDDVDIMTIMMIIMTMMTTMMIS